MYQIPKPSHGFQSKLNTTCVVLNFRDANHASRIPHLMWQIHMIAKWGGFSARDNLGRHVPTCRYRYLCL